MKVIYSERICHSSAAFSSRGRHNKERYDWIQRVHFLNPEDILGDMELMSEHIIIRIHLFLLNIYFRSKFCTKLLSIASFNMIILHADLFHAKIIFQFYGTNYVR